MLTVVVPPLINVQLAVTCPVETVAVALSGLYVPNATGVAETVHVTAAMLGNAQNVSTAASHTRRLLKSAGRNDAGMERNKFT